MRHFDVVIIGGGPAGSTVGTLLKKYSPSSKVGLLEAARFPRHHVGESLLAGATPVLKEMGVYDKVDAAGFPQKLGASYVWGATRERWGFEFEEINGQLQRDGIVLPQEYFKGWQVRRAQYDELLLDHAAECGVEVLQEAKVTDVRVGADRNRGVTFVHDNREQQWSADYVVDCSGQKAILGRKFGLREYDPLLNNVAIFGYWKGAKWKFEFAGFPGVTRILIASTTRGWIWYIPVERDTISIGFVTHKSFVSGGVDLKKLYLQELRESPEIADLLESATLGRVSDDQKSELLVERDWSYTCNRMSGDGWLLVGDAAGFVDPILSSGVMLSHQNGQKAAYLLNTIFSEGGANAAAYLDFYEKTYREMLSAYRQMAEYWYGNNFSRDGWWWHAWRQLLQANKGNSLNDRDSFMRLASGYANRTESTSLFGSYTISESTLLARHLFDQAGNPEAPSEEGRVSLSDKAAIEPGLIFYRGRIHRTHRVVNRENEAYLDLFPAEMPSIDMIKEGCGIGELLAQESQAVRTPGQLLHQLTNLGVVDRRETAAIALAASES